MPSKAEIKRMKKQAAKSRIKGVRLLLHGGSKKGSAPPPQLIPLVVAPQAVPLLDQDIGELGLDKEITFILRLGDRYTHGSSTIGQLIQKTEEEVLSLLRIGLVSLKKIKTALSEKGLALKVLRKF